jgi:hypothetical protein
MGRNHLCEQAIPKDPAHLLPGTCVPSRPSGLSLGFPRLSPSRRQLDYVLLARPPRYSPCGFHVRLACLIHAANVRSEPGSNPSLGSCFFPWRRPVSSDHSRAPEDQVACQSQPACAGQNQPLSIALTHFSFEATRYVKDRLAAPSGLRRSTARGGRR